MSGRKESCWMWYIIPTPPFIVNGIERGSERNKHYALRSDRQVRSYLSFVADGVDLRKNYVSILEAVLARLRSGQKASNLLGEVDEPKLRSSLKLFERATRGTGDDELRNVVYEVMRVLRLAPDPPV